VIIIDVLVIILTVLIFIFFAGMGPAGLLGVILFPYILAIGAGYFFIRIIGFIFRKSRLNEFTKLSRFKLFFIIVAVYVVIIPNPIVFLGYGGLTMLGIIFDCYILVCLLFWLTKRIFPRIWVPVMIVLLIAGAIVSGLIRSTIDSGGSQITMEELKNAEYLVSMPKYNKMVKLKNGSSGKSDAGAVYIQTNNVAFGDLNGDGKIDAVLPLGVNGSFNLVVMLNKDGKPLYLTQRNLGSDNNSSTKIDGKLIKDVQIQSVGVSSGIITIAIDYYDFNYNNSRKTFKYKLSGGQLVEVQ
jgi:hypothetical protein